MPVTIEEIKELRRRLEAAESELIRRRDDAARTTFQGQIDALKARIALILPEPPAGLAAAPAAAAAAGGGASLEAHAIAQAELDDIKKVGEDLLQSLLHPHAATIEGTTANPDIPDQTVEVIATTGDKLTIKYTKGKASISVPSTDGMSLAQITQLARNMVYFAFKTGAYQIDENGNITFIIRSHDPTLRTALEETVKSLGFKFKTPDYSNAARNQAHSTAADQTGLFAPISGTVLLMDPVARTTAKIAGIITDLNLRSSTKYQEKLQAVKENEILHAAIASVTSPSLKEKRIWRKKTSAEILKQIKSNNPRLYEEISKALSDHITALATPPTDADKLTKLHEIIEGLMGENDRKIAIIYNLLKDQKQTEIMSRAGFLREFEQGVAKDDKDEIAIENFKKNTIAGQVFTWRWLRAKDRAKQAEAIFAQRSKSPGKLDSMAKDGVGKTNRYEQQMNPEEIKTAEADPKAFAKHLTATGKARHAAKPKPSTPPTAANSA